MGLAFSQTVNLICLFHLWFRTTCQAFHQRAPSNQIKSYVGESVGAMKVIKHGHYHYLFLTGVSDKVEFDGDFSGDSEFLASNSNPWETQFQNLKVNRVMW